MEKKIFENVVLNCSFQQSDVLDTNECLSGLLSQNPDGSFSFTETVAKTRDIRNDKIFAGDLLSLVKMRNGRLQLHFKTLDPDFDRDQFRSSVMSEIDNALNTLV